jgi:hypothetical protein
VPHKPSEKFTAGFYLELARNLFSRLPYAIRKYQSGELQKKIRELASDGKIDLVVCDFLAPAGNVPTNFDCPPCFFNTTLKP